MRIAILDDWTDTVRTLDCLGNLAGHEFQIFTDHVTCPDALIERLAGVEALVLIRDRTAIDAQVIAALPSLRVISLWGSFQHVDLAACRSANVLVCSARSGSIPSFATAELTFALILAASRHLPSQMASLQAGTWQTAVGRSLRGRRLGIFGLGNIGRLVASYAVAFGMAVSVWGSPEGRKTARAAGYTVPNSRRDFFCGCDIVSLHLRLTPQTMYAITAEDLRTMGPDSILVNTSRAGLIEPGVLLAALDSGRPGIAAIDVFDIEPASPENEPLLTHQRVIATPHLGFATREELEARFATVFDQIRAFERGQPINVVSWPENMH